MNKKIFMCSFCKRNQSEVKKLIVGPSVYICDFCTNICAEILHEEDLVISPSSNNTHNFQLTPEEIYRKLDEVVAGQEEAKKELSIAAYLHYLRMNEDLKSENPTRESSINNTQIPAISTKLKKYNMLMVGPTGCGKTLLMQTLAKILNVAYIIVDANSLTEAGYVGEDVEGIITKLFNSIYYEGHPNIQECIRKTKYGFIFLDEIDKKYSVDNAMASRDVSGKGVQQNLLKIIEGTDVQISNKKNPHQEQIIINTSSIFVVAGGAFQGLNQIIRQSMKKLFSLGFMSKETHSNYKNPEVISDEQTEIMKHFNREHLVSFGMIPELVGRFECISVLNKLTENQLVEILRDKHDNVMEEYSKIFSLHNVQLTFDDKFLRAVAKKAMLENTGARALRSIIHKIFSSIIFTMPTLCNDKNKKYILHMSEEQVTGKETARIVEEITPSYTQAVQ